MKLYANSGAAEEKSPEMSASAQGPKIEEVD